MKKMWLHQNNENIFVVHEKNKQFQFLRFLFWWRNDLIQSTEINENRTENRWPNFKMWCSLALENLEKNVETG